MYRLKLDSGWLFNPDLPDYIVENGTLTFEANKLSTLKFTVYDSNPAFDGIKPITSLITIYRDNEIIGLSRPMRSKLNFRGGMEYTCEDILARLNDIKKRPGYFKGTDGGYLQHLIADYNTRAGNSGVTITLGNTPHSGADSTLEFFNDDYVGYWDLMQEKVITEYGGYLRPTYSESGVTLDYVGDEDLYESGQTIRFGENLDSLFIETDGAETFSVLIPLGADVSNPSAQGGMAKNTPLTIASKNGGLDYLESADGLAIYGRREMTQRWDDIKDAQALKDKGQEYLEQNAVRMARKIQLTAIDLRYAGVNVEYLDFLDRVPAISSRHDLQDVYTIKKMNISLNAPTASKIEMGDEQKTLTDQVKSNATTANKSYSALNSRVFDLEQG